METQQQAQEHEQDDHGRCPHCGANMKIWEFRLTPGLVDILRNFVGAVKQKGANNIHFAHDIKQANTQYVNFHKLRYWGLIARVKDAEGKSIAGHWLLTRLGGQFLRNEVAVPQAIKMWRNKISERSEEVVKIKNFFPGDGYTDEYFQSEFNFDIFQGKLL